MKILTYENRKSSPIYLDATGDNELYAYLAIFKVLDQGWQVYSDIDENSKQFDLLLKARKNDAEAAKKLVKSRRKYEYEEVSEEDVEHPVIFMRDYD